MISIFWENLEIVPVKEQVQFYVSIFSSLPSLLEICSLFRVYYSEGNLTEKK